MVTLRQHLLRHRWLTAWVIAAALLLKMLVPPGYMLGSEHGSIAVELCSGYGPVPVAMAMPGMTRHGDKHHGGKAEQPCAFAGLSAPALASADPLLLVVALAFIMAAAFRVDTRRVPYRRRHLRPPLRGPPLPS